MPGRRIGLGDDDDQVAVDAVRDERLRPVQDVLVAVADRGGGDPGQVGTGAGFGHRDRRDQRAGGDPGQPSGCLFVVADVEEVRRGDVVVERQPQAGPTDPGRCQLLGDHLVEPEVGDATAAVLARDRHPDEPVLTALGEQLAWSDAGSLPLEIVRA